MKKTRSFLLKFLCLTSFCLASYGPLIAGAPNPAASVLIIYSDDSCGGTPTYDGNGAMFIQQSLEASSPSPTVNLWEVPCELSASSSSEVGILNGVLNPSTPTNPVNPSQETTMTQAMLNSYCEVWDIRFVEDNYDPCNYYESDQIDASDSTFYSTYLAQNGNLFLAMDNAGFCIRDTSVVNFISAVLLCSIPFSSVGTINASPDYTNFTNTAPYNFATNDNTLSNWYTDFPGYLPSSAICGAAPLVTDSTGTTVVGMVWKPSSGGMLALSTDTNAFGEYTERTPPDSTYNSQVYQNYYTLLANCSKSPTPTPTITNSPTVTTSPTNTFSPTLTNTPQFTFTSTNTPTITPTPTATLTLTATSTLTSTLTPTPAPAVTIQKSVSASSAEPGNTLVYTFNLNVTGNTATNVQVQDVLPNDLTFVSNSAVPAGGVFTFTQPSTATITWSSLAVGSYQMNVTVTVGTSLASGTITNTAQLTYSGQVGSASSSVNVSIHSTLNVWPNPFNPTYAWNGELRASLVPAGAQMLIFSVSGELVWSYPTSGGLPVAGEIDWYGKNNKGVLVSTGTYYYVIKQGSTNLLVGKILVLMN